MSGAASSATLRTVRQSCEWLHVIHLAATMPFLQAEALCGTCYV